MKEKSRTSAWTLFRIIVVPIVFLCVIIQHPVMQWVAIAVVGGWAVLSAAPPVIAWFKGRKKFKERLEVAAPAAEKIPEGMNTADVFLIRQINYRITEMLKQSYPKVSWLWIKRPDVEEFRAGGVWKIALSACAPYNFAEVDLAATGKMELTLLQAVPLQEKEPVFQKVADSEDLASDEELDRTDAQTWYTQYGADRLAAIIDGLDPLGHKTLSIREDGEIVVKNGAKEVAVEKLEWMLPKIGWKDLCVLFKEDEIEVKTDDSCLVLNW